MLLTLCFDDSTLYLMILYSNDVDSSFSYYNTSLCYNDTSLLYNDASGHQI